MGTAKFNILDIAIAYSRLSKIKKYFSKNDVVLDFGCGRQCFFLRNINVKKAIGLDYDAENQTIGKNIKVIKYLFTKKLPFPNNSFTKITMLAVLEHLDLKRVEILFKEFKRILKKDGKIILTTPTPKSKPIMEFLANKLHIISKLEIKDHKKYYSKEDLEIIARKKGFSIEKYKTFQFGLNSLCVLKENHL